jgi:hypothetical protein
MLKSEETTINGTKYRVTQLPYSKGKSLMLRLSKVLGPAIAEAIAQAPKDQDLGDMQVSALGGSLSGAFDKLVHNLSEEDFDFAVETFGTYTHITDGKGQLKALDASEREFRYAGNWGELFQWLVFAFRVNYLGFSNGRDALTGVLARVQAMTSPSPSPSGSTGEPTE